ncbi:MAG: Holliday junction branch migration protein RuvA [Candidatus Bipolaricaulota bacterium]|nr:MAG: Holliday junction branch migration protein RuvA [Candidatus Bipolaricaulota bacterium]
MIDAVTGIVGRIGEDHVILETGGIAFHVFCPGRALPLLPPGEEREMFIHLALRDDALQLYGFPTRYERDVFRQLLPVGQVGPKLALQILSTMSPEQLVTAIAAGDVDALTTVKGVGRKTAQRIVIDLRDKLTSGAIPSEIPGGLPLSDDEVTALRALTSKSLGFSVRQARHAIQRLRDEKLSASELVRRALEILGSE